MQIIDEFAQYANGYLDELNNASVFPSASAIDNLKKFDVPLQSGPEDPGEVLSMLHQSGSPATVKSTGGRYFGFVIGGSLPAALGAKLLSTVWDQNAGMTIASPVSAALEKVAGKWLIELFGLPPECGFGFVSGDTMANFAGLAAGRNAVLKNAGWDVEARGVFNAPEIRVIVGDEVHVSLLKTLSMLGLGRERVTRIPADGQGRMIHEKIPVSEQPTIICAQAGNVNTGAFDDVGAICKKKGLNTWVHVDAAFGLWAAVSSQKKGLVRGIEEADSWATDAHKWLNVPYDCGVVFARDKSALFASMSGSPAAYLPTDSVREPFHYVPEMSREARGVPVWAALKSLGKQGLEKMVDRNCLQARNIAKAVTEAGFTVLNDVVLNQVLVDFGNPELTQRVIQGIQQEGTCWCGGTVWQGKTAMRISVSCWKTTDEDIDMSNQSMIRQAKLAMGQPAKA